MAQYGHNNTFDGNLEPGLEAPMFSPDDLLGSGVFKGLLAGGKMLGAGVKSVPVMAAMLRRDNPGGDWLKNNVLNTLAKGTNKFGAPNSMGTQTGSLVGDYRVPVSILESIKGLRGEQANVRNDSLEWLANHMKETGKLPMIDAGKEYKPFIQVGSDGIPWVNEGNHRIMAAKKLGWETLPAEIRYYNGGESIPGVLHPDIVQKFEKYK